MNILIINQPPFNRGDESAHKALIRTLLKRLPNANFRVLTKFEWKESIRQYAVEDERVSYVFEPVSYLKLSGFINIGLQKNRKWLWKIHPMMNLYKVHYKWADLVLCAPGGICMGGFQKWDHIFMLHLAKFYDKPLAYYGRSFGPFPTETGHNRIFKKLSMEMLNYFSFLSIRDHKTELLANEIGIPYVSTVDTAFLDSPDVEIPYEIKKAIGKEPYMVFVPNYLLWHYAYKGRITHETIMNFYSKMMDLIWDIDKNMNIVMLPQIFGKDNQYELSDVQMFRDLAKLKNSPKVILTSDNYSSDIQQTIISGAKYVVGARYHSIVFAINQGVPCVALSYEHKIAGLLESLEKKEWCVNFNDTLDSVENQKKTLDEVREVILSLKPDKTLQSKAKAKASACMDSFVDFVNRRW